jgi:hypothetical protein
MKFAGGLALSSTGNQRHVLELWNIVPCAMRVDSRERYSIREYDQGDGTLASQRCGLPLVRYNLTASA